MKPLSAKILLFLLALVLFSSCSAVKRVPDDQLLLVENRILVDGKVVNDNRIHNQLHQQPNARLLGFPLQLHIYNLAKPNPDSSFQNWVQKKQGREERLVKVLSAKQVQNLGKSYVGFNQWLQNTGQAPALATEESARRSANRLKAWYWNQGWFNSEVEYEIVPKEGQKAQVEYQVRLHQPYIIDSVHTRIASRAADSIFHSHLEASLIKPGQQYKTEDFNAERERITSLFRNNGLYYFEQSNITFEADTVETDAGVHTNLVIQNRSTNVEGVNTQVPYKVRTISEVNIFPDYSYENRNRPITDSTRIGQYHLYSFDKRKYRAQALTDAVFITPGTTYSDEDRTLTYNRLNQLRVFQYPDIQFMEDPRDTTGTNLIANIFLTPRKKYSLGFEFDISQSNIQDFGIGFGGSLLIRNIFRGAETLEISARGSVGSSADAADSEDRFFNISEVGADAKLTIPRFLFPIATERLIPKYMYPFTSLSIGTSNQNNIGLDRQNVTAIMNYRWSPSQTRSHLLDLVNLQYVRNLNVENYFNVYRNSFDELNFIATSPNVTADERYFRTTPEGNRVLHIPEGADAFLEDTRDGGFDLTSQQEQELNELRERKNRLTEDNLILASNFSYILNKKEDLYDEDFSRLRLKVETAGALLSGIASLTGFEQSANGNYELFGVNFSQYIKTEIDYIKHWDLGRGNVLAVRAFGGVAIPYGNANSIPFTRSFFAGGPNDNRAWQAYSLGPGSSGGRDEFNEANLKLSFSTEYRYQLFGDLNGAFFVDAGNIWNFMDVVEDPASTFNSLQDLDELAVGTGLGLRYDFSFFVLRFDVGFKTYNPARETKDRWFSDFNLKRAVFNVGINYPF